MSHFYRYMALVAKCTGGKRVNFSKSIQYTARTYAAAISHCTGSGWHANVWSGRNNSTLKTICLRRNKLQENRKTKPNIQTTTKKRASGPDLHYGPNAAAPDISYDEMEKKKTQFLENLSNKASSAEHIKAIERSTIGQHENSVWREVRLSYLTASNFGAVVKRRPQTKCHNLLKGILYSHNNLRTKGIVFGRMNETKAIKIYEERSNVAVEKCGFFICEAYPFLGASPDGLIGENGIIEVKCLESIKGKLIEALPKNVCYTVEGDRVTLKRNHKYYYQVQGQLNITKREYCDFVIFTESDFSIERIYKDTNLWNDFLVPKLISFYKGCMLPEIIDGRIPRGMQARDIQIK